MLAWSYQSSKPKKAKLSDDISAEDDILAKSPELQHKIPARPRAVQDDEESDSGENRGEKTNLFGVKYLMWFEVGIEGKDPMDQEEEDWGGKVEFGFDEKNFPKDIEDYFLLFEDKCDLTHACAGRVMGVASHFRDKVLKPPDYDPRDIVDLIDKYGDAHVSDSGWREVDTEEWFCERQKTQ